MAILEDMMLSEYRLENRKEKLTHLQSLEKIPSINPRAYSESESYQRLDYISHPDYGLGFVEEVIDRKTIKVFFHQGVKTLKQRQYNN